MTGVRNPLILSAFALMVVFTCRASFAADPPAGEPDKPKPAEGDQPGVTAPKGTRASERAVAAALNWLARHQMPDGHWDLKEYPSRCSDATCTGPGRADQKIAATALGLLPFLAAGQTHKAKGPYQERVAKAVAWLVLKQKANGDLRSAGGNLTTTSDGTMYTHGLATVALCEAYGLTADKDLAAAAQKAVGFIESAQHPKTGGWRYSPGDEGDTSVSGLQIIALKSAQVAGLKVAPDTLEGAKKFLQSTASGEHRERFSYLPKQPPTECMTAVGLLGSLYLGAKRDDPQIDAGAKVLMQRLPDASRRNAYYWYYGTATMHAKAGPDWDTWNRTLRRILIDSQVKEGCAAGSWDPAKPTQDTWGQIGGRLFITSLSTLSLEIYYRYLGLYKAAEKAGD